MIERENAQITTLDAGEVFIGGRYHSLIPIMQELDVNNLTNQYAVAVVKKGFLSNVQSLYDLRGKKACFAGVGTLAGWVLPVNIVSKRETDLNIDRFFKNVFLYNKIFFVQLMNYGGMKIIDCNNHVKSTIKFFGPSCAVNSLIDKYNPLGKFKMT